MEPVCIEGLGVHVPRYRLAAREVADFWGQGGHGGARSVANWDEDNITMAVEAAQHCLEDHDRRAVDTVILASTTHPYAEKQSAALVAEALDLPEDVETLDVASSLRAGTQALRLAADRVRATGQRVLVIAADMRLAPPKGREETAWGDAAAALLVNREGPVEMKWVAGGYETWLSHWRLSGERYGHDADSRFVSALTRRSLRLSLEHALKASADLGTSLSGVAIATPVPKVATQAAADAQIPEEAKLFGPDLQGSIGYTGAAASFLSLAVALEAAGSGETVAWVNSGDGADAALAIVHDAEPFGTPVSDAVQVSSPMPYSRYLRVREILADTPVAPYSSEIAQWRDAKHTARLHAVSCKGCGHISYPPQPVCPKCHRHDEMSDVALARTGRLFTFTVEHLFPNPERRFAMGVVELDDGVRFYCPITDVPPEDLHVGMPVRLTYRRFHLGGDFINYFWKATHAEEAVQ